MQKEESVRMCETVILLTTYSMSWLKPSETIISCSHTDLQPGGIRLPASVASTSDTSATSPRERCAHGRQLTASIAQAAETHVSYLFFSFFLLIFVFISSQPQKKTMDLLLFANL